MGRDCLSRVSSQQQSVDGVVLAVRPRDPGQPLSSEAGPLQCVGHYKVIEKGRVLFPDFIFLVNDAFFHRLIVRCQEGREPYLFSLTRHPPPVRQRTP